MDSQYTISSTVPFVLNCSLSVPLLSYLLVFSYAMHILTESSCSAQKTPITLEQQAILQASMEGKRNGIKQEANVYIRPKSSSLIC